MEQYYQLMNTITGSLIDETLPAITDEMLQSSSDTDDSYQKPEGEAGSDSISTAASNPNYKPIEITQTQSDAFTGI